MSTESAGELIANNGTNIETGGYVTLPMMVNALAEAIRCFVFEKSHYQDVLNKDSTAIESAF